MDSGVETGNDSNDSLVAQRENLVAMTSLGTSGQAQSSVNSAIEVVTNGNTSTDTSAEIIITPEAMVPALTNTVDPLQSTLNNSLVTYNNGLFGTIPNMFATPFVKLSLCPEFKDKVLNFGLPPIFNNDRALPAPTDILKTKWKKKTIRINRQSLLKNPRIEKLLPRKMRIAAATNNIEMVQRLLNEGVSPNVGDSQGRSPLHLAACRGYTEMVNLLLTHGADPNMRDSIGNTPLHLAAVTSKISVVTLLLMAGTDVLSSDNHGHNPLQLAQTKLRLIQTCQGSDMNCIKEEVRNIIGMLLAYLQKQKDAREQVEALSNFCSRLSLSSTSDQLQDDVRSLLANIDSLSLTN